MGNATTTDEKASDVMRPIGRRMHMSDTADDALRVMNEEKQSFLPVVAPGTDKLLGIVLKRALVNGCMRMGHRTDACRLQNHVMEEVDFCTVDEQLDREWLSPDEGPVLVVVDEDHRPVGYVER